MHQLKVDTLKGTLSDLGTFISTTCTHNGKHILVDGHENASNPTMYCCLQCVEKYLIKKALKEKIKYNKTSELGTKATTLLAGKDSE